MMVSNMNNELSVGAALQLQTRAAKKRKISPNHGFDVAAKKVCFHGFEVSKKPEWKDFKNKIKLSSSHDVYRGQCPAGCSVIIKILSKKRTISHNLECLRCIGLNPHENVIKYFGDMETSDSHQLVLEDGGQALKELIKTAEHLTIEDFNSIVYQIASGLEHLYSIGIEYNDLKEENIVFDGALLKIIDFGFANKTEFKPKERIYLPPPKVNGQLGYLILDLQLKMKFGDSDTYKKKERKLMTACFKGDKETIDDIINDNEFWLRDINMENRSLLTSSLEPQLETTV